MPNNMKRFIAGTLISGFLAGVSMSALAHNHGGGHKHGHGKAPDNAAVRAYMQANERMHENMNIDFTGDADIDFVKGMIPHHQGAIAMASVVLEHGEDPTIQTLAKQVIADQEAEINQMKQWLRDRGHTVD